MLQVPRTRTEEEWTLKLLARVRRPGAARILLRLRIRGVSGVEPAARARHVRGRRVPRSAQHHIIAGNAPQADFARGPGARAAGGPAVPIAAQGKFLLTIDNIMRGPELYGYPPQDVRWSGDNQRIYFQWKQASDPIDKPLDTWMIPRDSGYPRKLSDDDAQDRASGFRRSRRATASEPSTSAMATCSCTISPPTRPGSSPRPSDAENDPHFTQDEKRVAFTRGGNLYVMDLERRTRSSR